ncbi:hypothetical protein IW261DRAFT_1456883 [Armillaria novae-zelandiae]|uniref:Uncharacterized protein n=1 Tax=Armillaria novae-zelandiae TaxID=153914 RepID=A0AA39PJ36_9AGAR|nr:hypothetical protein IW261DRAFT_1456883 [Armillaria novae-zelandiae]
MINRSRPINCVFSALYTGSLGMLCFFGRDFLPVSFQPAISTVASIVVFGPIRHRCSHGRKIPYTGIYYDRLCSPNLGCGNFPSLEGFLSVTYSSCDDI